MRPSIWAELEHLGKVCRAMVRDMDALREEVPTVIGPAGSDGVDGSSGADGAPGERGERGSQGTAGLSGVDGRDGRQGERGVQGDAGNDGLRGRDGAGGLPGRDGEPGAVGEPGTDGVSGVRGVKGDKGDKGDAGPGITGVRLDGANLITAIDGVETNHGRVKPIGAFRPGADAGGGGGSHVVVDAAPLLITEDHVANAHQAIIGDATAGAIVIDISLAPKNQYTIKKKDGSVNRINFSEPIDGGAFSLLSQHETVDILRDASGDWWIMRGYTR